MNGKTKKVLEEENSNLKNELENLKLENESLKSNCKCNEEKAVKSTNFKCNKCDKSFGTFKDFKKHKSEHDNQGELLKCGQCDKTFDEDWKMNAHMKSHKNYQCDQCGKKFKYLEILKKHKQITEVKAQ